MEPPAKRLRFTPRDELRVDGSSVDLANAQQRLETGFPRESRQPYPVPSRTQQIPSYWRRELQKKSIKILPRAPAVTVTANVINIGILDGANEVSTTQISAPATATEITIANVGTLTVAGLAQATNPAVSGSSSAITGVSRTGSSSGSITTILSSSVPVNGTSNDRTITVTATSSLLVPIGNNTENTTTFASHRTIFTADGFTTTLYYSSDTDSTTGYRFGDIATSTFVTPTTTGTQDGGSTITQTSSIEATSTAAAPPGTINLTPQQQQVVGGVVGGVAGVALVLLGLLYFLKWYRQRLQTQGQLPEQMTMRHRQQPSADGHNLIPRNPMAETSRSTFLPVAAVKRSVSKLRPQSVYTHTLNHANHSYALHPDSERSFQRVSGRKLPPALLTGSDGYDDQAPVSPSSEYSLHPRSREMSGVSSYRESQISTNPFLDSAANDHGFKPVSTVGMSNSARSLSRSQLSIQTGGISAFNSSRQSDGTIMIRPSPARTPTTSSPTSLILPMHTPPLMAGNIPQMPPLHQFGQQWSPRKYSDETLGAQRAIIQRSVSGVSARSSSSVGGRFREDI